MDDLMNKLQSVLNDEQSMAQISELAKMLSGSSNEQNESGSSSNGLGELSALLGGSSSPPQSDNTGGIDAQTMLKLGSVISQATKNDDNINLLLALKPMVNGEKQAKIDRIISIFRLLAAYPALKESGLLGGEGLGLFK